MMSSGSMAAFAAAAEQPDADDTGRPAQGIVFTTASVQAIEAGDKTQTRRLISPGAVQPSWTKKKWPQLDLATAWVDRGPSPAGNNGPYLKAKRTDPTSPADDYTVVRLYPRYFVGDLLYVKETWGCPFADHPSVKDGRKPRPGDPVVYQAKPADSAQWDTGHPTIHAVFAWRSPMLMPRWAARIFLEVTRVRIERLQDMTRRDALAEGMKPELCECCMDADICDDPVREYHRLWDSLHTKPGTTWADNPLVIIYDIKRVNQDGSAFERK